jgi:RNA polymerase primary sigma factor
MTTHPHRLHGDPDGLAALDASVTQVLGGREERDLLNALGECRHNLADALKALPGSEGSDPGAEEESLAHYIARLRDGEGANGARLGAVARRYEELRSKLALANMRLVAHVAKRFRDRGISYSDLLQEGFCGLLEAIDRFDLSRETKLATYATWWIRQSMQRAVAAGAYPVRLSPRHLRQLAQNQDGIEGGQAEGASGSPEMIRRIHTATRPTVSLNSTLDGNSGFSLIQAMGEPESERAEDLEMDEAVGKLMGVLRPREQEVLELRYGLSGKDRLSLSQVGKVMSVSKERVRQIQDRALTKLRAAAADEALEEALLAR